MTIGWHRYCDARHVSADGTQVTVDLGDDRRHRVSVYDEADAYVVRGLVARRAVVASVPDLSIQVWQRNRAVSLIGFRIDHRDRLVGEAWIPKAGLTATEFQFHLRTVAVQCDRFEYILTGRDAE